MLTLPSRRGLLGADWTLEDVTRIAEGMPPLWLSPRLEGSWRDRISGVDLTTFSRANTAPTYELDGVGGLVAFTSGQRAIGVSPETGVRGGSIFGQRTQLLASPDAPATQSVTLSAVQHQLTLFGTGSVTLSGAATGTGASNRVSLAFTPTAGSVTFTVSGSVSRFNLTAGSVVYPHLGGQVTCPADVLTINGTNFSQWYNPTGMVVLVCFSNGNVATSATDSYIFDFSNSSNTAQRFSSRIGVQSITRGTMRSFVNTGSSFEYVVDSGIYANGTNGKIAIRCGTTNDFATSFNGSAEATDTIGSVGSALSSFNQLRIGDQSLVSASFNGYIHDLLAWPSTSPAGQRLQQLSAAL